MLIFWSTGSEKLFGHVPPDGVESSTFCMNGKHPIHYARGSAIEIVGGKKDLYVCHIYSAIRQGFLPSKVQGM